MKKYAKPTLEVISLTTAESIAAGDVYTTYYNYGSTAALGNGEMKSMESLGLGSSN